MAVGSLPGAKRAKGKDRIYTVPTSERAKLRQLTAEYRRYQRARAVLVKRHGQLLELVDQMAENRWLDWPEQKGKSRD